MVTSERFLLLHNGSLLFDETTKTTRCKLVFITSDTLGPVFSLPLERYRFKLYE